MYSLSLLILLSALALSLSQPVPPVPSIPLWYQAIYKYSRGDGELVYFANGYNGERGNNVYSFHTWKIDIVPGSSAYERPYNPQSFDPYANITLLSIGFKENGTVSDYSYFEGVGLFEGDFCVSTLLPAGDVYIGLDFDFMEPGGGSTFGLVYAGSENINTSFFTNITVQHWIIPETCQDIYFGSTPGDLDLNKVHSDRLRKLIQLDRDIALRFQGLEWYSEDRIDFVLSSINDILSTSSFRVSLSTIAYDSVLPITASLMRSYGLNNPNDLEYFLYYPVEGSHRRSSMKLTSNSGSSSSLIPVLYTMADGEQCNQKNITFEYAFLSSLTYDEAAQNSPLFVPSASCYAVVPSGPDTHSTKGMVAVQWLGITGALSFLFGGVLSFVFFSASGVSIGKSRLTRFIRKLCTCRCFRHRGVVEDVIDDHDQQLYAQRLLDVI